MPCMSTSPYHGTALRHLPWLWTAATKEWTSWTSPKSSSRFNDTPWRPLTKQRDNNSRLPERGTCRYFYAMLLNMFGDSIFSLYFCTRKHQEQSSSDGLTNRASSECRSKLVYILPSRERGRAIAQPCAREEGQ